MGFHSWNCCETKVSIPFNYMEDIVLVLPTDEVIRGKYDGYGNLITDKGKVFISTTVGRAAGILGPHEGTFDDPRCVEDLKEKVKYAFTKDFENYACPIIVDGKELYDGLAVNDLTANGTLVGVESNMHKIDKNIKLLVHYAYKGQKYKDLEVSTCCAHQGFFYTEDFTNFPEDYHEKEVG